MKMNPVVHFEMPYEDKERAAAFYAKAFGWGYEMLGPETGEYVVVKTTEFNVKTRMPKEPGRINGGLFHRTKQNPSPSVVVAVDDIHEAMEQVTAAGGTVLGGPDEISGVGLYCAIMDTEGNRMSILEPRDI
jgi:predicted enzyme related to lactoylglutathione lyase